MRVQAILCDTATIEGTSDFSWHDRVVADIDARWNAGRAASGVAAVPSVNVRVRFQLGAGAGGSMCAAASANPSIRC
jgi:hypothetical protein